MDQMTLFMVVGGLLILTLILAIADGTAPGRQRYLHCFRIQLLPDILKEANQLDRRGRAQAPRRVSKPEVYKATAPNQVWSWDITFLATSITGIFYRLYLMMDIYSRKIVGWKIHENETADHASLLIRKACLAEGISEQGLVLHSDNGSPMKGATMLTTLQRLGVVPSFSRPSVSNDNPYSESLFGTMKYTPAFPSKPFESLGAA
ncbi:MAG: DDE-type integrase/transposase/recombinase [Candidatus Thiodiazotropha sp. (ex Lucinoma aequizonata)]|nr:DDE-type integrase/transposase/recombinase [Candidatus Thiodiazotropha sp. (ex Lucinoma aequizonata)]MCU7903097.1 DDE-type integrase/transposase/recombinase [Candidatus Thiodiazotropha sp. (ex Lucinoma aequizonata)]